MTMRLPLANKQIAQQRYDICKQCNDFSPLLKLCRQCGCFALAKVRFYHTGCPVGKWGPVDKDDTVEFYTHEDLK